MIGLGSDKNLHGQLYYSPIEYHNMMQPRYFFTHPEGGENHERGMGNSHIRYFQQLDNH